MLKKLVQETSTCQLAHLTCYDAFLHKFFLTQVSCTSILRVC